MYYQNVRGLRTKLTTLLCNASICEYQVLMFTETNLSDDISDAELGLNNYLIFRKDRSKETSHKKTMGGVLLAVHKSIPCSLLPTESPIEQIYIKIGSPKAKCIIGCVYLPPDSPLESYLMVSDTVDSMSEKYPDINLCMAGDFNLPMATWTNEEVCAVGSPRTDVYVPPQTIQKIAATSDFCAFHNLFQSNFSYNINNVTLDLVLCHKILSVSQCDPLVLPVDGHHPPLFFKLTIPASSLNVVGPKTDNYYYDFKSADYALINDYLGGFCWENLFSNLDIDAMVNQFYEIVYNCLDLFVPLKKVPSGKFPRWFDQDLINLTIQKKIAHKNFKISKSAQDYQVFSDLRLQCRDLSRDCYRSFVQITEYNLCMDTKYFWNFVNSKRKAPVIPNILTLDNKTANMGPDAANLFATYFSSVYSSDNPYCPPEMSLNHLNLPDYSISISTIYTELSSLSPHKGPGPDGVHPILLKNCPFVLARPLHIIFNKSLQNGHFPTFWKTSYVIPIHKSGDKSDIQNYRPICIISTIAKLFERLVTQYLSTMLSSEIIPQQFGFCAGRNTELNLLTYTHYLLEALESGAEVHAVYTDFSKAFDRVPHNIIMRRLESLGVNGSLLSWIESLITGRVQLVKVGNFLSRELAVPSGVPQGSHLAPLLFNISINKVAPCFRSSEFLLFADDLKMFKVIANPNDSVALQRDLDEFVAWSRNNGMLINTSKCYVMRFSRRQEKTDFNYHIEGKTLTVADNIKDLGIIFDERLTFVPQIDSMVNRSLGMLGFIRRTAQDFQTVRSLKILFCSLVRSHLEYAPSVWDPQYAIHINRIERVQKKFLHHIHSIFFRDTDYNYLEMCRKLNLSTLQERRTNHDLSLLFKLLNSLVDCPFLTSCIGLHVPSVNTRRTQSFYQPFHRTNYGRNSFISRSVSMANQHPTLNFFCPPKDFRKQLLGRNAV